MIVPAFETTLAAALHLVRLGYELVPIEPTALVPLVPGGIADATGDTAVIAAWWTRWPRALIGVRLDPHGRGAALHVMADDRLTWLPDGAEGPIGGGKDPSILFVARIGADTSDANPAPAEGGKDDPAAAALAEVNRTHALVLTGDKAVILREGLSSGGDPEVRFLTIDAFKTWLGNRFVQHGDKRVPLGVAWLRSARRRSYAGVAFAPEGAPAEYFNLWQGFTVDPAPGDCSLFLDHVRANVCQGDEALFRWVMGWFAQMIQRPGEKLGTALVLRGKQGTGKTKVGEIVGSLLGPHYTLVADPRYVIGQFNSHMSSCLLLQADEGFWAGDKQAEGKLKSLITSSHNFIERKGVDAYPVRNLVRLLVTSNSNWVVPAGMEERRFAVVDVGDTAMQNHGYFAALDAQMDAGGRAALLHYLLSFDLASVNLRKVPSTAALFEQKLATLSHEEAWWFERLRHGTLLPSHAEWAGVVECDALFADYLASAERVGVRRRSLQTQFGLVLRRLVPELGRRRERLVSGPDDMEGRRAYVYELPDLEACRAHFAELCGGSVDWDGV